MISHWVFQARNFRLHTKRSLSSSVEYYRSLVTQNVLKEDLQQLKILKTLQQLQRLIDSFDFSPFDENQLVAGNDKVAKSEIRDKSISRIRGMYIHGTVGSGKSMIMDMFYNSCQLERKRRVHFHQFMLEVHQRIHRHKQHLLRTFGRDRHVNLSSSHDSIAVIAKEISNEAKLLCFDEFQVTDIADAIILSRLFGQIWSNGTVLVATSNRPPQDLYSDGINRKDFLPFISQLEKECLIRELKSTIDYRKSESIQLEHTFYIPNSPDNSQKLYQIYQKERQLFRDQQLNFMVDNPSFEERSLLVPSEGKMSIPVSFNRSFELLEADHEAGICWIDFHRLCEHDRGAADYKALTKYFHTVYLVEIPQLSKLSHNAARRFITFIDEIYNANLRLLFVADAPPMELFTQKHETWEEIESPEIAIPAQTVEDKTKNNALNTVPEETKKYGRSYESSKLTKQFLFYTF